MAIPASVRRQFLLAVLLLSRGSAWAHPTKENERLPMIGPAPGFALTDQAGQHVSLAGLHDKVLAITFIYVSCKDICPILTAKMAMLQRKLGADFGPRVRFVSITVEPEIDTPAVLASYAKAHGANLAGWSFLTGSPAQIKDVVKRYGAFAKRQKPGDVDHLFLTSLIDRRGNLRVQYLGYRFEPDEMLRDVHALMRE